MAKFNITFAESSVELSVGFSDESAFFVDFESGGSGYSAPVYAGAYEVRPAVTDQILPTADRLMKENVHVLAIPYHVVENNQRGVTAIIGGV